MKTNTILRTAAFAAVLALTAGNLRAEQEPRQLHPLDMAYQAELAKPRAGQNISRQFEPKWDTEMNRLYQEMMAGLHPKAAAALRKSQREWIEYRDAQFEMIGEFFNIGDGGLPSMYVGFASYARMNVTRERVLDLTNRWETYGMLRDEKGGPGSAPEDELPLGFWKDAKTGLSVMVTKVNSDKARAPGVDVDTRRVTISGPPPRQDKADDFLLPKEFSITHRTLTVRGHFNWDKQKPDSEQEPAEVSVVWKEGEVELKISRAQPAISNISAGSYVLKLVKQTSTDEN